MRFAAGEEDAFRAAYVRWAPVVYRLARRTLGNEADAEDVTQNVFVSAWRARGGFDATKGHLPSWLVGIARHRIADHLEARTREARRVEAAAAQPVEETTPDASDRIMIEEELRRLDPVPQQIVRLSYYDRMSHAEIADRMDLPIGTVKSHIRRSIQRIRIDWEVDDGAS